MDIAEQNRLLLDSFIQIGADKEDAPKPLSLLYSYGREGGLQAINRFLDRLETDSLTEQDKHRIRDHYIPRAKFLSRRQAIAGMITAATAPPMITGGLLARYYKRLSEEAALPAEQERYRKLEEYCALTFLGTGIPAAISTHALFQLREQLEDINSGQECQSVLLNISAALTPAMHAIVEKMTENRAQL